MSVLIVAFNSEEFIAEAIKSVLDQTFRDFELIIVDDNSTDNTYNIAYDFLRIDDRIKLFKNETNLGQFKNRNFIASMSNCEFIKYLDSDDVLHPTCLEKMFNIIIEHNDVAMVVDLNGGTPNEPVILSPNESVLNHFYGKSNILYQGPTAVMFRKSCLFEAGLFDINMGILSDTLLMLNISIKFKIIAISENLYKWRIHPNQVTQQQQNEYEMIVLRHKINNKILNLPNIPIDKNHIDKIKNNLASIAVRNLILKYLLKGYFYNFKRLVKELNLKVHDFCLALLPNN